MATIKDAYTAACNAGYIDQQKTSEQDFSNMLRDDDIRRAYYEHVRKYDQNFYSKDFDTFSANAKRLLEEGNAPRPSVAPAIPAASAMPAADGNPRVADYPAPTNAAEYEANRINQQFGKENNLQLGGQVGTERPMEQYSAEGLETRREQIMSEAERKKQQRIREQEQWEKEHPFFAALSGISHAGAMQTPSMKEKLEGTPTKMFAGKQQEQLREIEDELGRRAGDLYIPQAKETIKQSEDFVAQVRANDKKLSAGQKVNLNRAEYLLTKANEIANAGGRFDDSKAMANWWEGLKNDLDRDIIAGVGLARDVEINSIVEKVNNGKELTDDEAALLNAYFTLATATDARQFDLSTGYQIGQGTAQSLPFMIDMFVTRGAGAAAKRGLIKALTKAGFKDIARVERYLRMADTAGEAGKMSARDIARKASYEGIATPLQTVLMPSAWRQMQQEATEMRLERGENDLSLLDRTRLFTNATKETLTERVGGDMIDWGLGRVFGKMTQPWRLGGKGKYAVNKYIQSPIGETGEEYIGALIDLARSYNPLYDDESNEPLREGAKEMFSWEGLGKTFGTVLPMSILGGAANMAELRYKTGKMEKAREDIISRLHQAAGMSEEEARQIMAYTESAGTAEEFADRLDIVGRNIANAYEDMGADVDTKGKDGKTSGVIGGLQQELNDYAMYAASVNKIVEQFSADYDKLSDDEKQNAKQLLEQAKQDNRNRNILIDAGKLAIQEVNGVKNGSNNYLYNVSFADGSLQDGESAFVVGGNVAVTHNDEGAPMFDKAASEDEVVSVRIMHKDGTSEVKQVSVGELDLVQEPITAEEYLNERTNALYAEMVAAAEATTPAETTAPANGAAPAGTAVQPQKEMVRVVGYTTDGNGGRVAQLSAPINISGTITTIAPESMLDEIMAGEGYMKTEDGAWVRETAQQTQAVEPEQQPLPVNPEQPQPKAEPQQPQAENANTVPFAENLAAAPRNEQGKVDYAKIESADELARVVTAEMIGRKDVAKRYMEAKAKLASDTLKKTKHKNEDLDDPDAFLAVEQTISDLQNEVNRWNTAITALNSIRTAEEQAAYEAEHERLEAQRKARKQTETGSAGNNGGTMAARYAAAPKIDGNTGTITAANGQVLKGHYVLVSADGLTPSHDARNGFDMSEGYPTVDGKSINDRDYKNDPEEQAKVQQIAQQYNGNAIKNMPIVSDEGLVYNGNGRTMAGQLAAQQGTDGAYKQALTDNAAQFGFTAEQVASVPNARVVFQTDERLPYNTTTLALFNATEQQTQSNTAKAAANTRKLTPEAVGHIINAISGFENTDAFFSHNKAPFDLINTLIADGVLTDRDKASLIDGDRLSGAGKDMLMGVLFGTAFDEKTIRLLADNAQVQNSVMRALPQILENKGLGEYSLFDHINNAIAAIYVMRQRGMSFFEFTRQTVLFESPESTNNYTEFEMLLADEMMNGGVAAFREVLTKYNERAKQLAGGQVDIFGELTPRENIENAIVEYYKNKRNEQEDQPNGRAESPEQPSDRQGDGEIEPAMAGTQEGDWQTVTDMAAGEIIKKIEDEAEDFEEIELTPENWFAQFGEDGIVETPIGKVKMGENQYLKLAQKGREGKLGMIKPTLERPIIIIEDNSKSNDGQETERESSFIFVKAFVGKDGKRVYYFTSVTVKKDGQEVVVSNQEKTKNRISKLIQQGKLTWINNNSIPHPTPRVEGSVLLNDSRKPTNADNQPTVLGINPSGTEENSSSADKGTKKSANDQTNPQKSAEKVENASRNGENAGRKEQKEVFDSVDELDSAVSNILATYPAQSVHALVMRMLSQNGRLADDWMWEHNITTQSELEEWCLLAKKYEKARNAFHNKEDEEENWRKEYLEKHYPNYAKDGVETEAGKAEYRKLKEDNEYQQVKNNFDEEIEKLSVLYDKSGYVFREYEVELKYKHVTDFVNAIRKKYLPMARAIFGLKANEDVTQDVIDKATDEQRKEYDKIIRSYKKETKDFNRKRYFDLMQADKGEDKKAASKRKQNKRVRKQRVQGTQRAATKTQVSAIVEQLLKAMPGTRVHTVQTTEQAIEYITERQQKAQEQELNEYNAAFNEQLGKLNEDNADSIVMNLGNPSDVLLAAGVPNKPIKLYGNKLIKKAKLHGYSLSELRDLPNAIARPLAVFNNYNRDDNRSILTELRTNDGNFLVTINVGKGGVDVDFDIVTTVFGKEKNSVANWLNNGYATYIDKQRTLDYLHLSAPIAEASNNQELISAAKVVKSFENPKLLSEKSKLSRIFAHFQRVFHGSGADFDKFDSSHIGEGEGNQSYGYGMYVTEVKEVARSYARMNGFDGTEESAIRLKNDIVYGEKRIESLERLLEQFGGENEGISREINKYKSLVEKAKFKLSLQNTPLIYSVTIPDNTGANYLSYRGVLRGQDIDKIVNALYEHIVSTDEEGLYDNKQAKQSLREELESIFDRSAFGEDVYGNVSAYLGSDAAASKFLHSLGYVGIVYPTNSMAGGNTQGQNNYVIFDDSDLRIDSKERFALDEQGEVAGATMDDGTVLLVEDHIRIDTPFHEFAHKLYTYSKTSNSHLLDAINKYIAQAPQAIKDYVAKHYPDTIGTDAYLDEVFAWALSNQSEGNLRVFLRERGLDDQATAAEMSQAQSWYSRLWKAMQQLWGKVKSAFVKDNGKQYADLSVFDAYQTMSAEEIGNRLYDTLMGGKELPGMSNTPEAQYDELDYDSENLTDAQQFATDAVMQALDNAGIETEIVSEETAKAEVEKQQSDSSVRLMLQIMEQGTKGQSNHPIAGAKLQKNLQTTKENYKKLANSTKYAVSDISKSLGARNTGTSNYITIEAKNGKVFTLRISNHNATVSNFDNNGEKNGISIVISRHENNGVTNNGKAHIVEFFYSDKALNKAKGTPIADIIGALEQTLYSGEYTDPTGLAQVQEVNIPAELETTEFSIRTSPAPKRTGIGYKVFYLGKDGKLYPPMVANPNGADTPVGVWLNADAAPITGESKTGRPQVKAGGKGTQGGSGLLAYRPGWHLGEIPYALQFNRKDQSGNKTLFPKDFVWAEVEYAADVDYQQEAEKEGITENGKYRHSYAGLKHLPTDGFYRYRTNPNPETDPWIITGAMKVNRVLSNDEVDELVQKAGREPQQREFFKTSNGTVYGYAKGGKIYLTEKGINPNTPIHEYAHLWAKAMRKNNPQGWQSVVERLKGTPMWDEVVNDQNYQTLADDNAIASEVLARYSGKRGAERMENTAQQLISQAETRGEVANAVSLIQRVKKALQDFWKWVGTNLFDIKDFRSAEEVADRVLYDMLNGTDIRQREQKNTRAELDIRPDETLGEYARRIVEAKRKPNEEDVEFSISEAPTPDPYETRGDYVARFKMWYDQQHTFVAEREYVKAQKKARSKMENILQYVADRYRPLQQFQEFILSQGGSIRPSEQDADGNLVRPSADAYQDTTLATGRAGYQMQRFASHQLQDMADAIADILNNHALDWIDIRWNNIDTLFADRKDRKNGKPLTKRELIGIYAQAKDCQEAIEQGLPDRGAAGFLKNLQDQDGNPISHQDVISMVESVVPAEKIKTLWDAIHAATQFSLDYQLAKGMIDQDTHDRYTRRYYVPERGWRERDLDGRTDAYVEGRDVQLNGNPYNSALKKANGRESIASDPFAYIQSIAETTILSAERNSVKQKFLQLLLDNQEIGMQSGAWQIRCAYVVRMTDPSGVEQQVVTYDKPANEDDIITTIVPESMIEQRTRDERLQHRVAVMRDGQQYIIELQDEALANALNSNFQEARWLSNSVANVARTGVRYMSAINTQYNPAFALWNLFRDLQIGLINNIAKEDAAFTARFVKNIAAVQPTILRYILSDRFKGEEDFGIDKELSRYLQEYFESGAQTGFSYMRDIDTLGKEFDKMLKTQSEYKKAGKAAIGTLSIATELSELTVRFAEFATARQMGFTTEEAAAKAKEISVNFDRKGLLGGTFSGLYSFFNASIQGSWNILRSLKNQRARRTYIAVAAFYTALGVVNTLLNPDDPDDEVFFSDYDRQTNFLFGKIKLPVTHFFRMFFAAGVNLALFAQNKKTGKQTARDIVKFTMDEVIPASILQIQNAWGYNPYTDEYEWDWTQYIQQSAPSIISPVTDVALNRDFKGATVHREPFLSSEKGKLKNVAMEKRNTPTIYHDIANNLHRLSGGNPDIKTKGYRTDGWIDINPNDLQHLVEGYFGGSGAFFGDLYSTAVNAAQGEFDPTTVPVLNRAFRPYQQERSYTQQYWLLKNRVDAYDKWLDDTKKNDRQTYQAETQSELYRTYINANRALQGMRKPSDELPYSKEETKGKTQQLMQLNVEWNKAQ